MKPFSVTKNCTSPSTSGLFHSTWTWIRRNWGEHTDNRAYVDVLSWSDIWVLEELLGLFPGPLLWNRDASFLFLAVLVLRCIFLRCSPRGTPVSLHRGRAEGTHFSRKCSITAPRLPCSRMSFSADLGPTPLIGSR